MSNWADRDAPDPFGRYSPLLLWAFRLYLHWYFWRGFHGVRLSLTGLPGQHAGKPLVIYTNHPSWWDPALLLLVVPKLFPERLAFGPMDHRALGRYRLFERMGIFGINPTTLQGARDFLTIAGAGLALPSSVLCITAEGKFTDPRARPVQLRPGLTHLARRVPQAVFLPLAIEYNFWNESHPEALLRFGTPVEAGLDGRGDDLGARFEQALTDAMDALAAESITRNPALFESLLHGNAGVGGIYDAYRRSRAFVRGQKFDPRHEAR